LIREVYSSYSNVAEDLSLLGYDCMSWKNMMFKWNKQALFKAVVASHFNFMVLETLLIEQPL
jgi:hypothetical protein